MLPILAKSEVDRLIAELQDAQFKLETTPTTTLEFVHCLTFLDEIQVRVGAQTLSRTSSCLHHLDYGNEDVARNGSSAEAKIDGGYD